MSERTQHTDLEDCDDCDEKNSRIRALEARVCVDPAAHDQLMDSRRDRQAALIRVAEETARAEAAEATRDQLLELLKRKESLLQKAEAELAVEQKHHDDYHGPFQPDSYKRAAGRESGRPQGETGEAHWHDRDGPCEQCDKNWERIRSLEARVEQLLKERGPCEWVTDYDETTGKSYIYCAVHDDESKEELCLELARAGPADGA